jgi:hypothetical protein
MSFAVFQTMQTLKNFSIFKPEIRTSVVQELSSYRTETNRISKSKTILLMLFKE